MNSDMELAERAARAAGEVLLSYYGRPPEGVDSKSSETDLVSDADREAERVIRELLEAERPEDGLIAEEGSRSESESGRRWIVDPLDGTVNFLYGFPAWGVSIALEDEQGLALGLVLDPVRPELFAAVRGEGATLDGVPILVSGRTELARALVATGFSYEAERRAAQAELLLNVLPRVRDIRRVGAAALDRGGRRGRRRTRGRAGGPRGRRLPRASVRALRARQRTVMVVRSPIAVSS